MTAQAGSASLSFSAAPSARDVLRREFRARRCALGESTRIQAAKSFSAIARGRYLLRPGMRLALYMPHGSEADPAALMRAARALRCKVHLPLITDYRRNRMVFVPYEARDVLVPNRYGIFEPLARRHELVPIQRLDLIVLPLVAVDPRGWRLGSGAGFYDRCLRHLRNRAQWRRPKLVGLAYEFQRIARIEPQPWDIPVDAVLTENGLYRARNPSEPL